MEQPIKESNYGSQEIKFTSPLDPELESKVNSILSRMPEHLKASVTAATPNNVTQTKPPLTDLLQTGAFKRGEPIQPTSLAKNNEHLFKGSLVKNHLVIKEIASALPIGFYPTITDDDDSPRTSPTVPKSVFQSIKDKKKITPVSVVHSNNMTPIKAYQEVLNQRIEDALHRSQQIKTSPNSTQKTSQTHGISQYTSLPHTPAKNNESSNDKLGSRVGEAIARSESNLKKSGHLSSNAKSIGYTPQNNSANQISFNLSPSNLRIRYDGIGNFGSDSKFEGVNTSAAKYSEHILRSGEKSSDIEIAFNDAMKRSQALLKRNAEYSKTHTPEISRHESRTQQKNSPKQSLYVSQVEERTKSSGSFLTQTPPREKNLHVFNNAVKNMSPPGVYSSHFDQKPQTVEEKYEDGMSYSGEMLRNRKHGRGKLIYADGSRYEGEWEDGEKNGYGTQTLSNGSIHYEGEWQGGKYHGTGNLSNIHAEKLEGDFDYSSFMQLENYWERYEGEFDLGKWNGLGSVYLTNGEKFVGKFRYGKVHGTGTFYQSNGKNVTGEWREDIFTGAL